MEFSFEDLIGWRIVRGDEEVEKVGGGGQWSFCLRI